MRLFSLSLTAGALLTLGCLALTGTAWAAAPNDIIWDSPAKPGAPPAAAPAPAPAPKAGTTANATDSNGITWDGPSKAPPGTMSSGAPSAPSSNAAPDSAGIVWNTPGKPAAKAPPPPGSAPAQVANLGSGRANPSRDCHEFQTTIVIDGQKQPAHGTVCRQPDGTWRVVNN